MMEETLAKRVHHRRVLDSTEVQLELTVELVMQDAQGIGCTMARQHLCHILNKIINYKPIL